MTFETYKVMHIFGLASLLLGLGILISQFSQTLTEKKKTSLVIFGFISHGLGLSLILLSGFGMMARKGIISDIPSWVYEKGGIWLLIALSIRVVRVKPQWALIVAPAIPVLVAVAAYIATHHP